MTPSKDAAALLRRLLHVVELGDLDAPGPGGARLLLRMEGAAAAWETTAGPGVAEVIHLEQATPDQVGALPTAVPTSTPVCVRSGCDQPAPGGRLCPRHLYG